MFRLNLLILSILNYSMAVKFRISGGRNVEEGTLEYIVRLEKVLTWTDLRRVERKEYFPVCTGSAIAQNWTLTAAHCISTSDYRKVPLVERYDKLGKRARNISLTYAIVYGYRENHKKNTDKVVNVIDGFIPKTYNGVMTLLNNDIALLKNDPIHLSEYGVLGTIDMASVYTKRVTLTGYGGVNRTATRVKTTHDYNMPLQVLNATVLPCNPKSGEESGFLCVVKDCSSAKVKMCVGDSGGPVIYTSRIIGVNVAGPRHGCSNVLDYTGISVLVYIKLIAPFVEWIVDIIGNN